MDLARRPSVRAKRETLPSTFPKELLKNPFGLPIPVELPPVPPLASSASVPPSPRLPSALSPFTPKTPLSPQKLAAIANALGVHAASATSASSSTPKSPSASRYLLHVIPPTHLAPADDDDDEDDDGGRSSSLSPYPKAAPGFHTQFFRGTLVPLQPTLQSMLGAIAREYALPSTGGMILYLYHGGEMGPRITDEVWKLLWFKALKAEREDSARTLQTLPQSSPTSSYPSPASSEAHGSGLDFAMPSSLSLPIIAKVEFDVDRRKATWYDNWVKTRHLRRRPSTPASAHSAGFDYPLELELPKRSRASSLTGRGRADTGSSAGKFSVSSSDRAAADDEVEGVTRRVGLGIGYSTPRRKRGGNVPPPLKVLSDSPTDLEDDEDSHLAYRILIDGPPDGEEDLDFLGGANYNPRASHLIMKEKLDTLEKAMLQYSPRLEKPPEGELPVSASTLSPSPVLRNPSSIPSPNTFGEPVVPYPQFANGNVMYSPGIPSASRSQERFVAPSGDSFKFPEAPPKLTINGKPQQQPVPSPSTAQSPGYPMSPDPFAPKTFAALADAPGGPPPPRGSSLPGSRFSQDSMSEEGSASGRRERADSIISKGFRRLWRKSSGSGLAAAGRTPGANGVPPLPPMSPIPGSPHAGASSMAAQQAAYIAQQQQQPQTPQSPVPSLASTDTALASPNPKRGSDLDPFHFDQESRYPVPRGATMSAAASPSSPATPTGSVSKRGGTKGWGTGPRSPSVSSTNTTNETLVEEPRAAARKRPSILSMGRSRSGSIASAAAQGKHVSGQMQSLQAFLAEDPSQGATPPAARSGSGGGFI